MQAHQQGGAAPAAGGTKKRAIFEGPIKGGQGFAGTARGGREQKGTRSYDRKAFAFRRQNNANAKAKNL